MRHGDPGTASLHFQPGSSMVARTQGSSVAAVGREAGGNGVTLGDSQLAGDPGPCSQPVAQGQGYTVEQDVIAVVVPRFLSSEGILQRGDDRQIAEVADSLGGTQAQTIRARAPADGDGGEAAGWQCRTPGRAAPAPVLCQSDSPSKAKA